MNVKAYLCMRHMLVEGLPRFHGLDIYSCAPIDMAVWPTVIHSCVFVAEAESFALAHDEIMQMVEMHPHWRWMKPWLQRDGDSQVWCHDQRIVLRSNEA